jgi:5'-3' exonuclease
MNELPSVHLVDGTYELFRAHYSKRPSHLSPDGRELKGAVGLASSLLALLHHEKAPVTHGAVAFDNPIRSFRNELFDGYKSDEGVDPELREQFDEAEEAVRALGLVVWSMGRYEADDALATAAERFRHDALVQILSPDKDLGQCFIGDRVIGVDRRRNRTMTEETVRTDWGVDPIRIPDLLALVGDAADGIPGLRGFGLKGAAALLRAFGTIESIPLDTSLWPASIRGAAAMVETLRREREAALLYRRLATLERRVPLEETLDDLRWRGVPRSRFEAWCDRVGANSLRGRPTRWAADAGSSAPTLR